MARATSPKNCSVLACDKPLLARGYCSKHYQRWQRNGDPLASSQRLSRSPAERFWRRVIKLNHCWGWNGNHKRNTASSGSSEGRR